MSQPFCLPGKKTQRTLDDKLIMGQWCGVRLEHQRDALYVYTSPPHEQPRSRIAMKACHHYVLYRPGYKPSVNQDRNKSVGSLRPSCAVTRLQLRQWCSCRAGPELPCVCILLSALKAAVTLLSWLVAFSRGACSWCHSGACTSPRGSDRLESS